MFDRQKAKRAKPDHSIRHATASPAAGFLQRNSGCACGGDCPRCRGKYHLQAKLSVSQPGDPLEQEADRVAERVLRGPQATTPDNTGSNEGISVRVWRHLRPPAERSQAAPPGIDDVVRTAGEPLDPATRAFMEPRFGRDFSRVRVHSGANAEQPGQVHERLQTAHIHAGNTDRRSAAIPPVVHEVLTASGQSLAPATRSLMEPRFAHDFSQVRVHADRKATHAALALHARAYTLGNHIVFGPGEYAPETARGRRLLAHELTHVVQQGAATASPVALEVEGNDPTVAEKGIRTVASPMPISRAPNPMLAFDTSEADAIAGVEEKLAETNPIAGIGDPSGALAVLAGVSDDQALLNVLEHLEANYQLDQLRSVDPWYAAQTFAITAEDVYRLTGAMQTVHFAHAQPGTVYQSEIDDFVKLVGNFTEQRRVLFIRHILEQRGVDKDMVTETLEGVSVLDEMQSAGAVPDPSVQAAAGAVQPAPWNPPGGQPIPYYLGNEAHVAIAAHYREAHIGDLVFTNFSPISAILSAWEAMGNPVTGKSRASSLPLKPDIANLTRTHLYEIKPTLSAGLAVAEAKMYQGILARAGIPMTLGPTTEPGTAGVVPAPAGVYVFESPLPGAITYQYRRARLVPVRVRQRQEATSRSRFRLPRFELRPLTDAELKALGFGIAAAVTIGIGFILIMVLLSPVGA